MITLRIDSVNCPQNIIDGLEFLNNRYGRGDLVGFEEITLSGPNNSNGSGTVVCGLQYGTCKAKFTLKNGTLRFRGHQKKVA